MLQTKILRQRRKSAGNIETSLEERDWEAQLPIPKSCTSLLEWLTEWKMDQEHSVTLKLAG